MLKQRLAYKDEYEKFKHVSHRTPAAVILPVLFLPQLQVSIISIIWSHQLIACVLLHLPPYVTGLRFLDAKASLFPTAPGWSRLTNRILTKWANCQKNKKQNLLYSLNSALNKSDNIL